MACKGTLTLYHFFGKKSGLNTKVNLIQTSAYAKIWVLIPDKNGRQIENFWNSFFWSHFQ